MISLCCKPLLKFVWVCRFQAKRDIHDINVQAIIAYTNENQQTYRVGLLTFLKEPDLGILRRYIFDRQTEILNEIQQMNSALLEAV